MGRQRLGFIGAGVMGEVILRGIINKELFNPGQIWLADVDEKRLEKLRGEFGINRVSNNQVLVEEVDLIILAVKPQVAEQVLTRIEKKSWTGKLLVSIAAGISTTVLASWTDYQLAIARIMPNTPCLVGEGMSGICFNKYIAAEEEAIVKYIFESVGEICLVNEDLMNAVTGVSGSGPAYVYLMIEALCDGGVKAGLPRPVSMQLVVQTLLGAALMVKKTGKHPGELKDMVTSPGGTTIEALASLEQDGVRAALIKAVEVASRKAALLARES